MDLEKYISIIVVHNFGGKIEITDSDGVVVSPESVIDFMNDVAKKQKEQAGGE